MRRRLQKLAERWPQVACGSLVLATSACGSAPAHTAPAERPTAALAPAQPPPSGPAIVMLEGSRSRSVAPLAPFAGRGVVAPANESLARWVEPILDEDDPHLRARTIATGLRAAIVRRGSQLFAAHQDRGVTGPIALPPGTFWIGLDETDALYAARTDGTLLCATDLAKATDPAHFQPIVSIPSAVAWDVTEGRVVAAGGSFVFASSDGGASFQASPLPPGQSAAQIAARPDGVVAVLAHAGGDARNRSVWLSTDGARTFHASPFSARSLRRIGARILGDGGECEARLATDARTWNVTDERDDTWPLEHAWSRMLDVWTQAGGHVPSRALTLRDPAAPAPSTPHVDEQGLCPAKPPKAKGGGGSMFGVGGLGALGHGGIGTRTGVLRLLESRSPFVRRTRTSWGLLRDGTCDAADVVTQWKTDECRADRPLTRAPRIAKTDVEALRLQVLDAPPGCAPEHLFSVRGTAALLCKTGTLDRAVYLAGKDDRWYAEGTISCALPPRMFEAKDDGTFAIACDLRPDGGRALWVRRPGSLGTTGSLRKVDVEGAVAYRLLDNGRVAIVTTKGKDDSMSGFGLGTKSAAPKKDPAAERARHTFSVTIDAPDAAPSVVARDLYTTEDVAAIASTDTRLYFRLETPAQGAQSKPAARFVVLESGKLKTVPAKDAPEDVRDHGPLGLLGSAYSFATAAPGGLAADSTHLYWADTEAGQILRVGKSGGAPEILVRDLTGPLAVAVDDSRVYFTTIGTRYGDPGSVGYAPKTGGAYMLLGDGQFRPVAVAADATAVYWLTQGHERSATGFVYKVPKDGSAPSVLLDRLAKPEAMALSGGRLFVGGGFGEVVSVSVTGGPPTTLGARGSDVDALLVLGDKVLWPSGEEPALASVKTTGGPVSIELRTPLSVNALAASEKDLWLLETGTNRLARAAIGASRANILEQSMSNPTAVLADETGSVVRENGGARVRRFPLRADEAPTTLYERKAK